ncbi:hypothetical protein BP6252_09699 [Coleophoma cylindrospora]|uniref:Uncharacterized protein n=1 Tax=Coleophoma cylindrospora TaxID=1849047 RepID=A0A3D8QWZ3_9HELO|nr:hypothetical protein BP6252_09699 [Coleophoma cylindrospora]
MASSTLSARLRYLNESAHLLATAAPSTSRYLMSQCNALMFENEVEQPESHRRKVCGACGTVMVLGWAGHLEVETRRSKKKKASQAGVAKARAMIYTCDSCGRKTRHHFNNPPPPRRNISSQAAQPVASLSSSSTSANQLEAVPSANASTKKRAKSRKQGGLGALLAKQKASDQLSSGFGLGLMDLMKKG